MTKRTRNWLEMMGDRLVATEYARIFYLKGKEIECLECKIMTVDPNVAWYILPGSIRQKYINLDIITNVVTIPHINGWIFEGI